MRPCICDPVGWAARHHFWAKPSRRLWQTSPLSTTTLTRSISAAPVSWPRTSYAVCWSKIPSTTRWRLCGSSKENKSLLCWSFSLVDCFVFYRKRMTIDDSLEHPWIKVSASFLGCGLTLSRAECVAPGPSVHRETFSLGLLNLLNVLRKRSMLLLSGFTVRLLFIIGQSSSLDNTGV